MDHRTLVAFVSEIEKIAVDMRVLNQSVFKAPGVTKKLPQAAQRYVGVAAHGSPAITRPTQSQVRAMNRGITPAQHAHGEALGNRLEALTGMSQSKMDAALPHGTIYVNPEATARTFGVPTGGVQQKAISGMAGAHELFERGVHPRDVLPVMSYNGHVSPQVLMHEHNMVQRATGPGAKGAAGALRNARIATGESRGLRNLLHETMGPRSAEFFQGNAKIPKAVKKGVLRQVRENPNIILKGRDPSGIVDAHLHNMERAISGMEARNYMGTAGAAVQNRAA